MLFVRIASLLAVVLLFAAAPTTAAEWPHYAGDAARTATAPRATRDLDTIRWPVTPDTDEEFVWHSAPVVYTGRVFVNARLFVDDLHDGNLVIAYDVADGTRLWATPIEADVWDSWSSPAVDARNQTVLLGTGNVVYALHIASGAIAWQTPLADTVVNAAPVISSDLFNNATPANRAFITDYSGMGGDAGLYAINVDPYDAADNPYQPGEIVWTAAVPGAGGNTPAYYSGTVYVAGAGGTILAFSAVDGSLAWETDFDFSADYPDFTGFYGGVTVRDGHVYAASYVFYGAGDNSPLVKIDAATGDVVWHIPCERTNSIPIVTDDGRIYLSAGTEGYGSHVKIQAFQDNGASATKLWDTFEDTAGSLIVGGWSHQPVWSRGYIYAGAPDPASYYGPYTDLYVLDSSKTPADPNFVVAHYAGAGGSPGVADGDLYSFGQAGLLAFEPSPECLADLDGDGTVGISDLGTLLPAYRTSRGEPGYDSDADLNRDGTVDISDLGALLAVYRATCE